MQSVFCDYVACEYNLHKKIHLFQSLVIAHNRAPPDQWNPYMRWALRPLNPVVLLGVTGKSTEAPTLRRQYSVMQWWKAPP